MIADAHALLSTTERLLWSRHQVYRSALEVLPASAGFATEAHAAIDSPLVRGAVHRALTGSDPRPAEPLAVQWPIGRRRIDLLDRAVPVVDVPDADTVLSAVRAVLGGDARFLTAARPGFASANDLVRQGAALATEVSPTLAGELFPHVDLLAVLDGRSVLSASLREFPGLVMLAAPRHRLEAAEGLLHESAHSRLFDTMIVHDLLPATSAGLAPFTPSWRPGAAWPVEQAFAALHAYAVLAEFSRDLVRAGHEIDPRPPSLLAPAPDRVAEIGGWLTARVPALGRDAHPFIAALCGRESPTREPRATPTGRSAAAALLSPPRPVAGLTVHHDPEHGRTVAARPGTPARFYMLGADSGAVLDALGRPCADPVREAVRAYQRGRDVGDETAELAVAEIVALLEERSLVSREDLETPLSPQ